MARILILIHNLNFILMVKHDFRSKFLKRQVHVPYLNWLSRLEHLARQLLVFPWNQTVHLWKINYIYYALLVQYPFLAYTRQAWIVLFTQFCLKCLFVEDRNFRRKYAAQNAGNGVSELQKIFGGGMPPDPPSYARSFQMLRSDYWLDPPLRDVCTRVYRLPTLVPWIFINSICLLYNEIKHILKQRTIS